MTALDCRASWDGVIVGGFTFGNSSFGSTDAFTPVYGAVFGGTYDDVSSLVTAAEWQRGRNDLASGVLAGTGSVTILDTTGIYNPANPASPLVGKLKPLRPFYIKAPDSLGTVRGCFRGFLQDVPSHDASTIPATTTFTLVDLFAVLDGIFPTIAPTGPTTTGAAIGLILDAAGYTESALRSLAVGDSIATFSADGTKSALQLIRDLLEAEQGVAFINGDGVFVYLDRNDRYRRASVATINGTVSRIQTGSPLGNIVNRQDVTAGAGVTQTYTDTASAQDYNYRDGGSISTPYLANDQAALDAAQRIVSRKSTPRTLLSQMQLLSPVTGNLDQILQREFGDRVTIPSGGVGTTGTQGDYFIEQVSVNYTGQGGVLDATWILSARTAADQAFVFGQSVFADVLVGGDKSLTVSGNEVTDATRAASFSLGILASGQMCDGLLSDGSFGIRRAATNLFRRGQCDATGDFGQGVGVETISVDATTPAPFSPQSIKVTTTGSAANEGVIFLGVGGQAAAPGVSAVGSNYFKGVAGQSYRVFIRWRNTDASNTLGTIATFTATGSWQLLSSIIGSVAVAAGKTGDAIWLRVDINGTRAESFWVAHAMLEKGQSVVAPYVATSGGATATHAAGRVQAPASLLDETQCALVFRVRYGFASTATRAGSSYLFDWRDDANNLCGLWLDTANKWNAGRMAAGAGAPAQSAAQTFAKGDLATVAFAATATGVKVSVNGGAFVTVANTSIPTLAATLFDVGSQAGASQWDGDVLYAALLSGVLSDTDAATLNTLAASEPSYTSAIASLPAAHLTAVWNASTATYDDGTTADTFEL